MNNLKNVKLNGWQSSIFLVLHRNNRSYYPNILTLKYIFIADSMYMGAVQYVCRKGKPIRDCGGKFM